MLYILIGKLIFGLGLFLLGMKIVRDSFYQAAGKRLERLLKSLTTNLITSILTGIFVTMIIQSSSATTVIIISLVNASLLSLEQALGVIMGANIGTTITVQLISFKLEKYLWIVIILGLIVYLFYYVTKDKRVMYIARGLLGFNILFIGLELLSTIINGFQEFNWFISMLTYLIDKPLLGLVLGIVITAIIQSSSALTGIIVVLAKANLISLFLAVTIALGSNVGTCITAFIAGIGSSKTAQRTAVGHILFNVIGVVVLVPILPIFIRIITLTSNSLPRQIANAHTIFNIFNALLVLGIKDLFIRFIIEVTDD